MIETDQITPEERADMKEEYNHEESEKQAVEEKMLETAKKLKDLGVSEEKIASATGLSLDEVMAL